MLFGGTDLTLRIAEALVELGMPPACVIHVGHGFTISYSPGGVKNRKFADMAGWARDRGVEAHEYESVDPTIAILQRLRPGIGIAAGWYHRLPARLRRVFTRGVLGIHSSLLPKYRGGAPLNWALLQGERETGVSLFELTDGVDDGPLYGRMDYETVAGLAGEHLSGKRNRRLSIWSLLYVEGRSRCFVGAQPQQAPYTATGRRVRGPAPVRSTFIPARSSRRTRAGY